MNEASISNCRLVCCIVGCLCGEPERSVPGLKYDSDSTMDLSTITP